MNMKNKELQAILARFPENMPIKLRVHDNVIVDFTNENILKHSEKAWADDSAPSDTWDHEDGKVRQKGKKYIIINPIVK